MGYTLTNCSTNTKFINFSLLLFIIFPLASLAAEKNTDTQQLKSAISLRQTNQHHQAVDILEDLLKNHGDHKRINIELAINYIKLADFSRSQEILDHLKTLDLTEKENKKLANLVKLVKSKQSKKISAHQFSTDLSLFYGLDRYTAEFPIYEYYEFFYLFVKKLIKINMKSAKFCLAKVEIHYKNCDFSLKNSFKYRLEVIETIYNAQEPI